MRIDKAGAPFAFYRRLTAIKGSTWFSLYASLLSAFDATAVGNVYDKDWRAYSTESDALDDVDPWTTCAWSDRDPAAVGGA